VPAPPDHRASAAPPRPWTVADFAVVWLCGLLGAGAFYASGRGRGEAALALSLAGQYFGNLAALWAIGRRREAGALRFVVEPRDTAYVGLGLALQVSLALLFLPLARLLFPDGRPPQEVAEMIRDPATSTTLKLVLVCAAALLAPVAEELMFRGALLRALERRGRVFAAAGSALVFAAVHILGLGGDRIWASAAVALPPIFGFGLVLAWLTFRTGRLGPAVFAHSGWNLLAALAYLVS